MDDLSYYLVLAIGFLFEYSPFAIAIGLGLLLPAIVVAMSGFTKRFPDHQKLTVIFACIVLGSTFATAMSGRILIGEADLALHPNLAHMAAQQQGNPWFSRIAHLILMTVSISEVFMWITQKRRMGKSQFAIWSAAMAYYFFSIVASAMIGTFRGFEITYCYAPIVFTATALLVSSDYKKNLQALRWILLFPLAGSLMAIFLAPKLVLESGYVGLIPGLHFRLAGLTPHANALGVVALIALFLELSRFVQRRPNIIFLLISGANLVLCQSKTAWVIGIVGLLILFIAGVQKNQSQRGRQGQQFSLAIFSSAFFLLTLGASVLLLKFNSLQSYLAADSTGLESFSGRTKIWSITWNEFLANPVSGYGPAIWDPLYRYQHAMTYVGQAHNQYIQTIGQAGLIGIASLALYIYLLIKRSYQGWNETDGFCFLIVIVLLVRGFSECPMLMIGILDFDNFAHLLVFTSVAAISFQSRAKEDVPMKAVLS